MGRWWQGIPMKIEADTAAENFIWRDPLFQVDSNHVLHCGICFEMDVITLRLRLHCDSELMEVGNQYGCKVKSTGHFKERSCDKLKLGTMKEV